MAYNFKNYTVRRNKIKKSFYRGFCLNENAELSVSSCEEGHIIFLPFIDSGEDNLKWGRLKIDAVLKGEMLISIHAFASNHLSLIKGNQKLDLEYYLLSDHIKIEDKKTLFSQNDMFEVKNFVGFQDVLLYGIKGRYLWICIEMIGNGSGTIYNINVNSSENIVLDAFPEIYQDSNSFFCRYLSVFSSIFMDFEYEIEGIHQRMDLETASLKLLKIYGKWFGIDLTGSYLEKSKLRKLLMEAHSLNRLKGTKKVIKKLSQLLLDMEVMIVERNLLFDYSSENDIQNKLYGDSPYDFTILVHGRANEQDQSQLLFILKQFMPMRCKIHIVFLSECDSLDSYCYLDINATIYSGVSGILDNSHFIDGSTILK